MNIRVFDFFSGCGGASCGLRAAGMEIAFALDSDAAAGATFEANFPEADFLVGDIRQATVAEIQCRVDAGGTGPTLFVGCPPCQPFSELKTRRRTPGEDGRVSLLDDFTRLVAGCRPDFVLTENVPGMRTGRPFLDLLRQLDEIGYGVDFRTLEVADYGVPQFRRRLVLAASRRGPIRLPAPTHWFGPAGGRWVTVRQAIGGLPPIGAGEVHPSVPDHRARRLSALNLERIRVTAAGGGNRDWPDRLRLRCHRGRDGYGNVYGRMAWDRPGPTLTTQCTNYGCGKFGHPQQDRPISVREAARLQTFPDEFVFRGSMESVSRQVGNAVPPRLAELVGRQVLRRAAADGQGRGRAQ